MIPPCLPGPPAFLWRLIRFTFSTVTVHFLRSTASTRPRRGLPASPLASPERTTTVSPLRMWKALVAGSGCFFFFPTVGLLDHFRSEGDDLHEFLLAQLARDGSEDARSLGLLVVVDQDHGVVVEADVGAVLATALLDRAHHHRLGHVALLHGGARDRVLDRHDHDVAHTAVPPAGSAQDLDALGPPRAGVVGHGEHRAKLDHRSLHGGATGGPGAAGYLARSTNSTNRQRLSLDMGRVSMKRMMSPSLHSFFSSWT